MKTQQIQRSGIIFFLITCWASWSLAQSQECEAGIYIGKIGNVPVSMSINHAPDPKYKEPRVASMYYRSNMSDVVLKQEPGQADWAEFDDSNKPSGWMTLNCLDKQLSGEWVSINGKSRLALSAQRSPDDAYNKRRFAALKPANTIAKTQDGVKFETFALALPSGLGSGVTGIRLVGNVAGAVKVNRLLWQEILWEAESLIGCAMYRLQNHGAWGVVEGGFEQSFSYLVGDYIVVRSTSGAECGNGMSFSEERKAYDVTRGNRLDFKQWFKPELREHRDDKWQETALAKIISQLGQAQHGKDNKEGFEDAEFSVNNGYPSEDGMVFEGGFYQPSKFCRGSADVTVPYANVVPYLSTEGKRAVKAIEQAIAKKRLAQNP